MADLENQSSLKSRLSASTSAGPSRVLLIGELESRTLIQDLDDFSSELRRAARQIKKSTSEPTVSRQRHAGSRRSALSSKLRQYFDEFSGKRRLGSRPHSIADCYHGTHAAIRDAFQGSSEILKSQAIDLTVIARKRIFLFEVKTSAKSQNVYTAIGQLAAHAPTVAKYAPGKELVRVIVLPDHPTPRLCDVLANGLDIRVLTFTRSAGGEITINGLKHLS
jgi:hypothetical protein